MIRIPCQVGWWTFLIDTSDNTHTTIYREQQKLTLKIMESCTIWIVFSTVASIIHATDVLTFCLFTKTVTLWISLYCINHSGTSVDMNRNVCREVRYRVKMLSYTLRCFKTQCALYGGWFPCSDEQKEESEEIKSFYILCCLMSIIHESVYTHKCVGMIIHMKSIWSSF